MHATIQHAYILAYNDVFSAGVAAGTELLLSTARELMGKPALVKEPKITPPAPSTPPKRHSANGPQPQTNTTTVLDVLDVLDSADEFDLAMLGAGRSRRVNEVYPSETPPKPKVESKVEVKVETKAEPKVEPKPHKPDRVEDKKPPPAPPVRVAAPEKPVRKNKSIIITTLRGHLQVFKTWKARHPHSFFF